MTLCGARQMSDEIKGNVLKWACRYCMRMQEARWRLCAHFVTLTNVTLSNETINILPHAGPVETRL